MAGAALALGIPSLAHDAEDLADHHADCDAEHWYDRPGTRDIHFVVRTDPATSHDTITADLDMCHRDIDELGLHWELERGYDNVHPYVEWFCRHRRAWCPPWSPTSTPRHPTH